MSHSNRIKLAQREVGVSKHVPITHLNSPTIFESTSGMLGMVMRCEGVTFETEKDEVLNQYKQSWHRALTSLDDRFSVMSTVHRRREDMRLTGEFKNTFLKECDQLYHKQFQDQSMYVNDIYITVIYKGITTGKIGKGLSLLKKLSDKALSDMRDVTRQNQIKCLKEAVSQLKISLSAFKPHLLGENDNQLGYSELLRFLGLSINGGQALSLRAPKQTPAIASSIAQIKNAQNLYPYGNLANYLPAKQILFGEAIQFQGATSDDCRFGAIITVKEYGSSTASINFDPLLHLDSEFINTHTFAIEAKDVALKYISREITKKENVSDPAISQIEALHEARDMLASGFIKVGYHHNTLMLLSDNLKALEKSVAKAIKCYGDAGFVAVKETLGQEPAFWSQIPTNMKYIARASLVTSENFVDFCPLHNYRTGFRDGNHLGAAVTLLETPSKTPFFFNYHTKGSIDNPAKGHTTIIGGNNSGKTTLMCFMDAQMTRYGGQTFYFDRDRGAEIYIRACGGYYARLTPDIPSSACFNPLQLEDKAENRQFNRDLLIQFCKKEEENELDAELVNDLTRCIDYAYEQLAEEHRTLSNATKLLPMDFPRWPMLRRWLRGQGAVSDGEYAYLFDNPIDQLQLGYEKMGFDLTHFLDREPASVRTPLMMYLFARIEQALHGQRVSILLDEGWQYLSDAYWKGKLSRWLPTIRKKNGHLVLATQSPSSVADSPIRNVIQDNVASQIFFANPQAKKVDYIDGFNLINSEFNAIKNNIPESRLFLFKQGHDSSLCRLSLGHLRQLLRVLSGNTKSVKLVDQICEELGDNPNIWLSEFYRKGGAL